MRKNQQFHNDKLKRERQGMRGAESNCHIQLQTEQLTVLTALVLICSTMVAPDFACTLKNASAVVRYRPSLEVQAACFMHAQVYLAGTSLGKNSAPTIGSRSSVRHRDCRSLNAGSMTARIRADRNSIGEMRRAPRAGFRPG